MHTQSILTRYITRHLKVLMTPLLLLTTLLLTLTSAWADPGGGGGNLGGGGASGPEPSQWYFMLTGALVLGALAFYRARTAAPTSSDTVLNDNASGDDD